MTDKEEMIQAVQNIVDEVTEAFPGHVGRLEQLRQHAATVQMVIEHIFDEDETGAHR